ncbi:MAG: DsbA family protein, partial [Candidatus Nanoarchaeia archaeon]
MEEHQPSESSKKDSGTITLKKDTLWKVGTFVFAALFLISIFGGGFSFGNGSGGTGTGRAVAPSAAPPSAPSQGGAPAGNIRVPITDEDPILGNPDATISIVEFSDFQCPFCQRAHTGALTDFKNSNYFSNGEVNLVYKHFPLNSIHPQAQKAAEASECANRQGKFWEYHDLLFANQQSLDVNSLKSYAS